MLTPSLGLKFASLPGMKSIFGIFGILLLASVGTVSAQVLASADFADYSDGALVGQNGWQRYLTQTTSPLTVDAGAVSWAGNSTVNNEDAFLAFPFQVNQPASGTTILHYDLLMSVSFAPASNPSYFAALNSLTSNITTSNFANARITAISEGSGFVFGARVNGQGGYPFAYGLDMLDYGTFYAVRAEIHMVAGNANDFINLYVGPDFDNLGLYTTATYSSGTVADPSYGSVLLSQFGSGSVFEPGVSIESISVTIIPEPSVLALLVGSGLLGGVIWRRRMGRTV